ncbi:hypothetical protein QUB68_28270 [Microcoleus sp. A006_D1]|uniref:hypothetical protein n=1 Tax=Microcoleus sp. A006_D1 TaxID=3055267 RepID=UPI002FD55611
MLKVRGGLGVVRLFGAIASATGFGLAMHFAGEDEREQQKFWFRQSALDTVAQKFEQTFAEIDASTELNKKQMEAQAEVDLFSLRVRQNFRDAIGYVPQNCEQPALPHGKPGTLDEFTNPGDKIDDNEHNNALKSGNSITQELLKSQIASVALAGFLKLIGTPGSGKTTLTSALIRCRIESGHQLIIINSHKRKSMYQYIEPFLVAQTSVYGVGIGDKKRAKSLLDGLTKILEILSSRYDEYQNQDEDTFDHFPVTLLLEEIGDWEPLLALTLPVAEVESILQNFWRKLFIAARKGRFFPLITAQTDTQAMFKAKGLSGLFKESGAVTLNLSAVPDSESKDGWKPSEVGSLKLPNRLPVEVVIPDVRSLIFDLDDFADCSQKSQQDLTDWPVEPVVETPPTSTTPPPTLHLGLHQLEALMHQDSTSLQPIPENWQFPDPMQPLTPEVRAVVVNCKRSGLTQNAAVLAIWGLAKSGSDKRYEAARNHYQSVIV